MTIKDLNTIITRKYSRSAERQTELEADGVDIEVISWHNGYQVALSEIQQLLQEATA